MLPRIAMLRRIVPCLAVLLAPVVASAANGSKPRIPVSWSEAACATVVDQSTTSTVHFEYFVDKEDDPEATGGRTADEVDDSRTQQFFAFRKLDFTAGNTLELPIWITQSDIDRSAIVDPMVMDMVEAGIDPATLLEGGTRFAASEWTRITADDARVPITNAQAAMGVDWDVSAVAPGAYAIWGYTWEPIKNKWSLRPGFVKVIASADQADAVGPAIAIDFEEATVTACQPHPLMGCVDAPAGSTITLEWGDVEGSVEPEWKPLLEDEPIESGPLTLDLVLPAEAAEAAGTIKLRATVTDPSGKQYVAYSPGSYPTSPGDCPDEGGGGHGCCSVSGGELRGTASLLLFAGLFVRRRRRCAAPVRT